MIAHGLPEFGCLLAQLESIAPVEWRLRWNWDWPLWLVVLVIVAATVWVMMIYLRETTSASKGMRALLGGLRLTALALALLMFSQPALHWFRLGQPRLVLLVDRSASMGTQDHYAETSEDVSRFKAWQKLLTEGDRCLIDRWQSDYQLDVILFDEEIEPLDKSTDSLAQRLLATEIATEVTRGTRLGDTIDYALRELPGPPPVAMVVLTDGIVTHGQALEQAAQRARQLHVPLYTVAIGSHRRRPDIAIENLLVAEIVFPGDRLQVEATVRARGYEGKSVDVILRDASGGDLTRTNIRLPGDEERTKVSLAIRPDQPGELALELAIKPLEEEADTENNVVRQTVEVRDEKIKVLLVQAQPSYEYRALKSLLQRDPAVELRVTLQEADVDYFKVDDAALRVFPTSEKELFTYDVLLLGDVDFRLLPRSVGPLIERFVVEHGGGMVGIAGPRFMPLAYQGIRSLELLLPMELGSLNPLRSQIGGVETFAISPTVLGWRTPSLQLGDTLAQSEQIWSGLPPLSWMLRIDDVKPGAQVLVEHPQSTNRQGQRLPVILRHYVGAGEVLFHATDETWRWRWRSDDRYFARYWGQVIRRLGRGRLAAGREGVKLTANRSLYEPGETVQLEVRFRNPAQAPAEADQVMVQVQAATGPSRQIVLQRRLGRRELFAANVDSLAPSEYEAFLVRPYLDGAPESIRFVIRQPPRELAEVVVNRQGLRQAAEISGGKFYTLATTSQLAAELPSPRQPAPSELPPRQLWNSHALIALFVIVLTAEWFLRRRYGML